MQGEHAQDELITFSLLNYGNLKMNNIFLSRKVLGKWSAVKKDSIKNRIVYEKVKAVNKTGVYILHPVK